jgi:hypothetical protein
MIVTDILIRSSEPVILQTVASIATSPGLLVAPTTTASRVIYGNIGLDIKLSDQVILSSIWIVVRAAASGYPDISTKPIYPAGSMITIAILHGGDIAYMRTGAVVAAGMPLSASAATPGRVALFAIQWRLTALTDPFALGIDEWIPVQVQ